MLHWQNDWIALSFVKHQETSQDLQELIAEHSEYKIPIIKIEMPEALENIDKIVVLWCFNGCSWRFRSWTSCSWSPFSSKELIRRAKTARIPVIVTQMMETMITSLLTYPCRSKWRCQLCYGCRCSNAFWRNSYR
jgi:pyruvate kinase